MSNIQHFHGTTWGKKPVAVLASQKRIKAPRGFCGECGTEIVPGTSVQDSALGPLHPICKRTVDLADRKASLSQRRLPKN